MCQPGELWVIVQRPHTGPAAAPIPHPPRGHPLGPGALPAAQHLRRHTEQPQHRIGALHRAHAVAGVRSQALIRRPAVTPGAVIGVAGPRRRDRQQRAPADRVARHHRPHLGVIAAVKGHRNRPRHPTLQPPRPTRHPRPRRLTQLESDRRNRLSRVSPAITMPGRRQPPRPRPRTHHTTTRPHRRTTAIQRRGRTRTRCGQKMITKRGVAWNSRQVCATVRPVEQDSSLRGSGNPWPASRGFRRLFSCHVCLDAIQ
ncbi:hypothetical protein MYCOZU2_02152 [Mycobacterium intracellulare subsp. chimaera]|uniref:Uncharacterized protein n=1 Tax=Mycobacterium intracellulare subsp. chimaera TaxID=222805 RepID=A0A7U5MJ96_MYCIT|nr:hypothetical protein MYCOZU2_02152 [Mycobacterium intracellulare subsp. chimaera]